MAGLQGKPGKPGQAGQPGADGQVKLGTFIGSKIFFLKYCPCPQRSPPVLNKTKMGV